MAVSFTLSSEQQQLRDAVRTFAREHLAPAMIEVRGTLDPKQRAGLLRRPFESAVAAGLLRGLIPAPFGGTATNGIDASIFIEEIAAESPDFLITLAGPLIALAPV